MELNITNIQHFSVGDGKGIRTTLFLKGCNLKCPWCHNPETLCSAPTRMEYKNKPAEVLGKRIETRELLCELLEDKAFFEESGGGVTISGGECMLQAKGVAELASLLRENGVSVLIDTAGNVPYSAFEATNGKADGYLFDFKSADREKLFNKTGANLSLVYENLVKLLKDGQNVRVRIPLIPDFNTDTEDIEKICGLLRSANVTEVDLLPFHRLGSGKYEAMGQTYEYAKTEPLTKEELSKIEQQYKKHFKVYTER